MDIHLYWCTLNQQIVERHPTRVPISICGQTDWPMGYKDIRKTMTFIGVL
jgi:hypothetical protein